MLINAANAKGRIKSQPSRIVLNLEILLSIFDEAEIWDSPEEKPPPKDTGMWGILGGRAWEGLRLGGGLEAGVKGQPLETVLGRPGPQTSAL